MLLVTVELIVQGTRYTYAHVMQSNDFRVTDREWVTERDTLLMYDSSSLTDLREFTRFVQRIDPTLPGVTHMVGVRAWVQHFELAALVLQ